MKVKRFLIFLFFVCLLGCKKSNETLTDDNKKHVKLLWRNTQFDWITSSLIAKNDRLYFGNINSDFYSVKLESGKVYFKIKSNYNPFHKPIIQDQNIFLYGYSSDLSCFDMFGKPKWEIRGGINLRNDLAENNKYIYGSFQENGFGKLNKTDGKVVWSLPKDSNITETNRPEFYKNIIYLGKSEYSSEILAINDENGTIIWKNKYEDFSNINQITTEKGLLVCLDKDFIKGKIVMLDYESGNEIWSKSINCDEYYKPCVAGNSIILSTHDNQIVSVNIENGKTNWSLNLKKDCAESSIISFKKNIYFGTTNRDLYSVNNETGKIDFIQPFNYGLATPIVHGNKIYFPTGGNEIWVLK